MATNLHRDYQCSVVSVTNASAAVLERYAYDAFGKRRSPNGTADPNDAIRALYTDRGYTNHEHLDVLGLINMNGRFYDPSLARFMSADPYIQPPDNLQSYNRYSYVMNNPLRLIDPSGYWPLFRTKDVKKAVKVIITVAVVYFTGGAAAGALGYTGAATYGAAIGAATKASFLHGIAVGASMGFAGGFTSGLLNGQSVEDALKSGAYGALTGGVMGGVGNLVAGWSTTAQIGAKATSSGAIAHLQGGNFNDAFKVSLGFAAAAEFYRNVVGFEPTAEPGKNMGRLANGTECGPGTNCFKYTANGDLPDYAENINVITRNSPYTVSSSVFSDVHGGPLSRLLNFIPGMNNFARLHDKFINPINGVQGEFLNFASMPPALALSYPALLDKIPIDRHRCPSCGQ